MDDAAHWNEKIPGDWSPLYALDEILMHGGKLCRAENGVYRLVGLSKSRVKAPAVIGWVCGRDRTGTLYIGRAKLSTRIRELARSLREWNDDIRLSAGHHAGSRLRANPALSNCYTFDKLALVWFYDNNHVVIENQLLAIYANSFGEPPPLNGQEGLAFQTLSAH